MLSVLIVFSSYQLIPLVMFLQIHYIIAISYNWIYHPLRFITYGIGMINDSIKKAIDVVGSQAALSRACGVSQPAVFRWLNGSRVKADYVMSIVRATNGQVKAYEIRPDLADIFPHPISKKCTAKQAQ